MDAIAASIGDEVIIQLGYTAYKPINAKYFRFANHDEIEEQCKKANIVITHGGVGSIMDALNHRKPLIVVPRLLKYGEAYDDHQSEIVDILSRSGLLTAVYDINQLDDAILKLKNDPIKNTFVYDFKSQRSMLISFVDTYLRNLDKTKKSR